MAKRKAVRGSSRKPPAKGRSSSRRRVMSKKTASSRKIARKAARKSAKKTKASARKTSKAAVRRAMPAARPRVVAKKKTSTARKSAPVKAKVKAKAKAPRTSPAASPVKRTAPKAVARPAARTAPGLNRERRTISDEDRMPPSPPSSLDLDRTASAARSGRRELLERFAEHTETSPAMTGGDVDADWESAYSVGDEAPGGDNPTPDQDIVDDIGKAVGVQYNDNEELKGEKKLLERDKHRWELDPASSDDWEDR
jgi:Family of unknown function (DUF6335)